MEPSQVRLPLRAAIEAKDLDAAIDAFAPDAVLLVSRARVDDQDIEVVDHMRLRSDGRIEEFTVFFRPLPATLSLAILIRQGTADGEGALTGCVRTKQTGRIRRGSDDTGRARTEPGQGRKESEQVRKPGGKGDIMAVREPSPAAQSFAEALRMLREAAGNPTLGRLAQLTKLPTSTIDDHLSGRRVRVPRWEFVSAYVSACHQVAEETGLGSEHLGSLDDWHVRHVAAQRSAGPVQQDPVRGQEERGPERITGPRRFVYAHKTLTLILACVLTLAVAGLIVFISWPSPASRHDRPAQGPAGGPPIATLSWSHPTPASVDGSPAVAGGFVYIADDDGTVYALIARTGGVRWTYAAHSQITSRPFVLGNTVYVGDDASKFYALSATTGRVRWVADFSGGVDSSPMAAGGIVYVGDGNNIVHAVSAASGDNLWNYSTNGTVNSTPVVSDGIVYIGSDDRNVYALSARTGHVVWAAQTGGEVNSSPALAGGVVYIGSDNHKVYALQAATGQVIWSKATSGAVKSSPFTYRGMVYVGSDDGRVYALAEADGRQVWSMRTGGAVDSSPFVYRGIVYVGSYDGNVYAISAASGHVEWTYQTGGYVKSSPVAVGGLVYVGSDNNEIIALRAGPVAAGS